MIAIGANAAYIISGLCEKRDLEFYIVSHRIDPTVVHHGFSVDRNESTRDSGHTFSVIIDHSTFFSSNQLWEPSISDDCVVGTKAEDEEIAVSERRLSGSKICQSLFTSHRFVVGNRLEQHGSGFARSSPIRCKYSSN